MNAKQKRKRGSETQMYAKNMEQEILIKAGAVTLEGHILTSAKTRGWVIFAHGSGSSRKSSRNNWVARELNKHGFSTLLFDLLTYQEDMIYQNRFQISLLAERLLAATQWLVNSEFYKNEPIIYFGASTGAAAALMSAAEANAEWQLKGVISRGGRPDLTGEEFFSYINVPVLLIIGGYDTEVIKINLSAASKLKRVNVEIVPEATHLFEEPGKLNEVVQICLKWLDRIISHGIENEINQNGF